MSEIRANSITNVAGTGAPNFPNGLTVNGGSAGGTQTFTATGAITAGNLVGLNANGTVSVVTSYIGGATVFESASINYGNLAKSCFDTVNNRVVVLYQDVGNSNFLTVAVGSISGATITFGTPVVVLSANALGNYDIAFDPINAKVLVVYNNYTSGGTFGVVGTVSGTSISFGSASSSIDGTTSYFYNGVVACCYHPSSGRFVVSYGVQSNGPYFRVATISGTSVSFGSQVQGSNTTLYGGSGLGANYGMSLTVDTVNDRVVYGAVLNLTGVTPQNYAFQSFVGTVSGTTITVGSAVPVAGLGTTSANSVAVSYNSASSKVLFAAAASSGLTLYSGTVSGTTVSYPDSVIVSTALTSRASLTPYPKGGLTAFSYMQGNLLQFSLISAAGLSVSLPTPLPLAGGYLTSSASTGAVVAAGIRLSDNFGVAAVIDANSTYPTWVGIAAQNIANGASGPVTVAGGINTAVSGLTSGTTYAVNPSTGVFIAATSNVVGTALSSTSIYLNSGKVS
jgi:hypothetical protein